MKGENHVIPEDQTEDFHTKGELPSNDHSAANDLDSEKRKSNERSVDSCLCLINLVFLRIHLFGIQEMDFEHVYDL